ncbi:hypothetical protein DCAR_0417295 [Daucus carota subsp. sativus]|uniref:Uncharacterized protein n=1 Tax=Daucus carota subsp. sativus TaxID=79200 RepID=A0AAF0WYF3_DAUCS|nr:hypothetical protein DCAR_0417295 [Daucus carota subsp. sativus]
MLSQVACIGTCYKQRPFSTLSTGSKLQVEFHELDMLFTPPDTPLFTCLDDEVPPLNLLKIFDDHLPHLENPQHPPTPRRVSTSSISNIVASSGIRGISPVKSNRGNSASPKVRAWQSNIPGFPSEAPPNLPTSLADRPASYVRGSSPASRNGREFPSKSRSPTTATSIGSSHSHDRDRFSSPSKDSLVSIPVGSSEQSSTRRMSSSPNNRAPAFSKKPFRTVASNSAPKRSFDLALRQMVCCSLLMLSLYLWDHRKSPQNMFRPLLSSVPSSTLYAGKTSPAQHAITSGNSITSSNASSDQVTGAEHDTEGSEQNQDDVTSAFMESLEAPLVYTKDEFYDSDKAGAVNESIMHETQDGSSSSQHADLGGSHEIYENHGNHFSGMATVAASGTSDAALDHDGPEDMLLCQSCGNMYYDTDLTDAEFKVCHDCRSNEYLTISNVVTAPITAGNFPVANSRILEESGSFGITDPSVVVPVSAAVTNIAESGTSQHENTSKENTGSYSEPIWDFLSTDSVSGNVAEESDQRHPNPRVVGQPTTSYCVPDGGTGDQQMKRSHDYPPVNASGGAGISVLLNRSSSGRGAFLQSRSFTASSNSYDDSSYVRDSAYSLRSSYGHGSLSASSSVDLGLYRQTEARVQRQLSGKQSDLENYRHDMNTKHQRTGSSLSAASNPALQTSSFAPGMLEQSPDVSLSQVRNDAVATLADAEEHLLSSENMEEDDVRTDGESTYKCKTMDPSPSESSTNILNKHQLSTLTSFSNSEESSSYENVEDLTNNLKNVVVVEASTNSLESSVVGEETVPSSSVDMESTVMVVGKGGSKARSLTLEEATDAILFCSSIVHDMAYNAATIAIEKENPAPVEGSRPTVTILGKANPERKKAKPRRDESDTKPPSNSSNDENIDVSTNRIVGAYDNDAKSMKAPPKLESKCNCTIM